VERCISSRRRKEKHKAVRWMRNMGTFQRKVEIIIIRRRRSRIKYCDCGKMRTNFSGRFLSHYYQCLKDIQSLEA
jgi:hypothetical protein